MLYTEWALTSKVSNDMKGRRKLQVVTGMLVFVTGLMLSGCGSMELGILTPEPADAGLGIPEGVIIAREVALTHLRENHGESAPPAGLQWQGDYVEQGGMVGAGAYQFTSGSWVVNIEYPIVAPEATVYSIELSSSDSSFHWQGQVDARGEVIEDEPSQDSVLVTAWLGHISSAPLERGAEQVFSLSPEGAGEFEITSDIAEVQTDIDALRDAEGSQEFVHVWGTLTCGVDAYNGCRLVADRVRYGTTVTEPEDVEAWDGVIFSRSQPPGSGGDDYFVLAGDYPVEYGIWSQDENIRTELEGLRDSGTLIRVWGEIVAGIPDWAGTQLRVERFESIESSGSDVPIQPTQAPVDRGWKTYINERYGYEIQFPPEADLEEMGIHGYESDAEGNPVGDIPRDLEPDEVFDYLLERFGENLCVQIRYSLGYITISAPENEGFRYATCGRTGVGVGELIQKDEVVLVDGYEVQSGGFEFQSGGDSLVEHNETFNFTLEDGTRIEYGSRPEGDATYQDYLMKTKPVLLEILSTYGSR